VAFKPEKGNLEKHIVEKNTQLLSYSHQYKTECPFFTSYEMDLHPIMLEKVDYFTNGYASTIELNFSVTSGGVLDNLKLDKLRFYLGGSEFVSQELHLFLHRYVTSIEVSIPNLQDKSIGFKLDANAIESVGFAENENILPKHQNVFHAYVLMQEYFCYRDKFNFIDMKGFEKLRGLKGDILESQNSFRVSIHFDRHLSIADDLRLENFRLFCTPAVNLVKTESVPLRKTHKDEEYEVVPADLEIENTEVFMIKKVEGWTEDKSKYAHFLPFGSFEHAELNQEFYFTKVKLSEENNRLRTFIRFAPNTVEYDALLNKKMVITVEILATNKNIPSTLNLGSVNSLHSSAKISNLELENITIPTKSYLPPLEGDFLWRLISNMSLNYLSLGNITTFRTLIQAYDFPGMSDAFFHRRTESLLRGLDKISYKTSEMIYKGLPIRGIETSIELDPDRYTSLGEAYIFSNVLNDFLTLYCNLNTFHRLEVKIDRYETFTWKARLGQQSLM
jgi:type VI secretion system protein ImpG